MQVATTIFLDIDMTDPNTIQTMVSHKDIIFQVSLMSRSLIGYKTQSFPFNNF